MNNQRERLVAAMSVAVGEQGYAETTVAHVIAIAGVSRKAFYQHFANREDCFLATYDLIVADNLAHVTRACDGARTPAKGVQAAIGAMFDRAIEDPLEVKIALVEIAGLGNSGTQRRERLLSSYEQALAESMKLGEQPCVLPRAIVGGVVHVLHTRVRSAREQQLQRLAPLMADWISSYRPAPAGMSAAEDAPAAVSSELLSGRAPGTLWPSRPTSGQRRGLRGEHIGSHSFVVHSQRERILDAVATLSASKGYSAVTVKDISEVAAVSLDAFYEHFEGKEDAFLVAYEIGHGKARAAVEYAYDAAGDWRLAVRAAIGALFRFLAAEPAFAHLSLVDARVATSRAADRAIKGMGTYAQLLVPRLEDMPASRRPPDVVIEAIAGGIFELCVSYTMQGRTQELPQLITQATYFALAPFIGPGEAARVATDSVKVVRRSPGRR
jgi:AcrR family transcriptional regulator